MSLRAFLETHNLAYESVYHEHAESGQRCASATHQPGDKVAKAVLLKDDDGYLLAVLPATHRLHFGQLHHTLQRHVGLATEDEAATVFTDCETGAIPPVGLLYDIDTVVDDALLEQSDIYFEAGDHNHLLHMNQENFRKLVGDATHTSISYHV